jgi:hypothetical protein
MPAGTYDLVLGGAGALYEDAGLIGDLDITGEVALVGAGRSNTTITTSSSEAERAVDIQPGATANLSGLTVRNLPYFFTPFDCGKAIRNQGVLIVDEFALSNNSMRGDGGAICNEASGILLITDSIIDGNCACFTGRGGGIFNTGIAILRRTGVSANTVEVGDGGGVYSLGTLVVSDSLIAGNRTSAPFGERRGGGVRSGPITVLTNVTVSGNSTDPTLDSTGDQRGAGLMLVRDAILTNMTIANNSSGTTAGGIFVWPEGNVQIVNSIVSGNLGGDCVGPVTSAGNNLGGDGSCQLTAPSDSMNIDPMLGLLQDNGGSTLTQAPMQGSPAVDNGSDLRCPAGDQRVLARPVDGDGDSLAKCDIGAHEAGAAQPAVVPLGDATCGGEVNSLDALAVLRLSARLPVSAGCLADSDLNCDYRINSIDALLTLRLAVALPISAGCT